MIRGKFITLEGGEEIGKTTNLIFIKDYLQQHNIPVVVTREPGVQCRPKKTPFIAGQVEQLQKIYKISEA